MYIPSAMRICEPLSAALTLSATVTVSSMNSPFTPLARVMYSD